jgi:shikimate kinase
MIERGEIFEAMTANGVAIAGVTNDYDAIRICNLAIINGAISAGISGSGPAIAIICYNEDIEKIEKILMSENRGIIKTKFLTKL